jgi:predicted nuclease with RNAse H fold
MSVSKQFVAAATEADSPDPECVVLGIDLRSGPRYPTGLAALGLDRRLRQLAVARTDEEIEAAVERWRPALIAIDAPLALPEGRCCADKTCECARFGIFREIDRLCAALGYRPFPTLLPSMVGLTLRGKALGERLAERGERVVEVYPGMVQDILGIPRKQAGLPALTRGLRRAGVRGIPRARRVTHVELDAATCALAAAMHLEGRTETLGPGIPVPFVFPARQPAMA